jgi:methylase of polypeptide subunit release factors
LTRRVVKELGELLREAGFGRARHLALMDLPAGMPPAGALTAFNRPDDARLATLLSLFHDGRTVEPAEAARAVDPLTVEDLIEAGLVDADPSGLRSRVMLSALAGIVISGDTPRDWGNAGFVTPLSPPGKAVAYTTVRRRVRTALDLGTGSGIQALLAARHAERVFGVDVNPHALAMAEVSQRLNDVENVAWIEGDWFEPVDGQSFDLVVANPPVVISPDNTVLTRDSEIGGEELSREIVRECAAHLAEGGFATVLCTWAYGAGAANEGPTGWVAGLGCDALVLTFSTQEPLPYAMANAAGPRSDDSAVITQTVKRWLRHYRDTGVERISVGVVVMRRHSQGPNWVRAFEADGAPTGPGGDRLERMFAGGDFLAAHSGAAQLGKLLTTAWQVPDGQRLDQALVYQNGAYASGDAVIRQEPGLNLSARVDWRAVPVVVGCDGRRPLGEVLRGTPVPEGVDQAAFHTLCLTAVRDLVARGFLVAGPVRDGAPPAAG